MNNTSTYILAGALFIIMLGMGLSLVIDDFKRILKFPKAITIGLINQIILLPLIAFALVKILNLSPEIAIGIMILAACPGGPTSNLIAHLAKGDTALSVTLTAVSSFITILTIPFIVNFSLYEIFNESTVIPLEWKKTVIQIFAIVVIPIIIGMLIKAQNSSFADKMAKPVRIASAVVLGLVIVGIILKEKAHFVDYFKHAGIAALLLNVVTMAVGYFTSKLLGLNKKQSISISIESGIQNGTMAIGIATVMLGNVTFAIAPAVYSLIMFFTGGAIIAYGMKNISSNNNEDNTQHSPSDSLVE